MTTERALAIVSPSLHERFRELVAAGDWRGALHCCESEQRIALCLALRELIPDDAWPDVLVQALSDGDAPSSQHFELSSVLSDLFYDGRRSFDGDAARDQFAALPERVTIYRGTVADEANSGDYGVCWTLDRDRAIWFATKHGRFRNTSSPPVLLTAEIWRDDISGLLVERGESEVIVSFEALDQVSFEPLS